MKNSLFKIEEIEKPKQYNCEWKTLGYSDKETCKNCDCWMKSSEKLQKKLEMINSPKILIEQMKNMEGYKDKETLIKIREEKEKNIYPNLGNNKKLFGIFSKITKTQ